jgi:hypothetical protein
VLILKKLQTLPEQRIDAAESTNASWRLASVGLNVEVYGSYDTRTVDPVKKNETGRSGISSRLAVVAAIVVPIVVPMWGYEE